MIVQIYEIQTPSEAEKMIDLGVDQIGSVILSESSWKEPVLRETIKLSQSSGSCSSLIPLFSDRDLIRRTLDYYQPDIIHFCEMLSIHSRILDACHRWIDRQQHLKERYPEMKIMRSIPIGPSGMAEQVPTIDLAELFAPVSDFFLTDTLLLNPIEGSSQPDQQPVNGYIGITGRTCDWHMARRLVEFSTIPVILAGGISPLNVAQGIAQVQPAGIDSCTGTNAVDDRGEPIRFKKDLQKVKSMIESARKAEKILNSRQNNP